MHALRHLYARRVSSQVTAAAAAAAAGTCMQRALNPLISALNLCDFVPLDLLHHSDESALRCSLSRKHDTSALTFAFAKSVTRGACGLRQAVTSPVAMRGCVGGEGLETRVDAAGVVHTARRGRWTTM